MNNLLRIIEKTKSANMLYEAQLLVIKNGEVIPYRRSVFEKKNQANTKRNKIKR